MPHVYPPTLPFLRQGIFTNFKNVVSTGRVKIPFGIAIIHLSIYIFVSLCQDLDLCLDLYI